MCCQVVWGGFTHKSSSGRRSVTLLQPVGPALILLHSVYSEFGVVWCVLGCFHSPTQKLIDRSNIVENKKKNNTHTCTHTHTKKKQKKKKTHTQKKKKKKKKN